MTPTVTIIHRTLPIRCPACRDHLGKGPPVKPCPECQTAHHIECLAEIGCASLNCNAAGSGAENGDGATIRIADGAFRVVDTALVTGDGRPIYEWSLTLDNRQQWSATDLSGGCGREPSEREMLGTLLSFLGAAIESREYRERYPISAESIDDSSESLFPREMVDWACEHSDDITMASIEIEESESE